MPIVLILIGVVLAVAGIRGTAGKLGTLLIGEFTGGGKFIYWVAAIGIIGLVGYVNKLRPLSEAFILLLMVVLFLANGRGFFDRFNQAMRDIAGMMPQTGASPSPASTLAPLQPLRGFSV